jgi:hypothetical protein
MFFGSVITQLTVVLSSKCTSRELRFFYRISFSNKTCFSTELHCYSQLIHAYPQLIQAFFIFGSNIRLKAFPVGHLVGFWYGDKRFLKKFGQ